MILALMTVVMAIVAGACEGPQGPPGPSGGDKQTRFLLSLSDASTSDTAGVILGDLIKFNKSNYNGVDSIVFVADLSTDDTTYSCIAELYNITNRRVVDSSLIAGKGELPARSISRNLYAKLPAVEIDLGARVRTTEQGRPARCGRMYLFLYRK